MAAGDEPAKALITARVKEQERYWDAPVGMQATAAALRERATKMVDSNDREAILRLAEGYDQRAGDTLLRLKRRRETTSL